MVTGVSYGIEGPTEERTGRLAVDLQLEGLRVASPRAKRASKFVLGIQVFGASALTIDQPRKTGERRCWRIVRGDRGEHEQADLLALDQPMGKIEGGITGWVKPNDLKDGTSESINGEVDFTVEVEGRNMAEASVCIAAATGLPLQRPRRCTSPPET